MKSKQRTKKPSTKPRPARTRQQIIDWLNKLGISLILADGFEEAFLGVDYDDNDLPRAVYSRDKCIEILSREMQHEEAIEFFDFNVDCAYVGHQTPIYIDTIPQP